jgi:hypothetical protein
MALAPLDLVYDFMQRTGRVDEARLRRDSPAFMKRFAERITADATSLPN